MRIRENYFNYELIPKPLLLKREGAWSLDNQEEVSRKQRVKILKNQAAAVVTSLLALVLIPNM